MPRRKIAVEDEFDREENSVTHGPLNTTFYAYPGSPEICRYIVGHLRSVLPNGDDYDEDSVWRIARRLIAERPAAKRAVPL
jgi:hypothetical protein